MIEKILSVQPGPKARALIGKYAGKTVAICGGGRTVWTDLRDAPHDDVMAVNDVGMFMPGHLEHWFSLHGEQFSGWETVREFHHAPAKHLHSTVNVNRCLMWPVPSKGTSVLAATYVALCLGYDRVILCGAPFTDDGHFFDPPWIATNFSNECLPDVWQRANATIFEGRVKSMSGLSRDILGAP